MTQTYEEPGALALVENRPLTSATGVMPIVTPEEARAQMQAYTALVAAVIGDEDYQTFKERGKEKRFKKKSAVKKLQTYFGFTVSIIDEATHRDDLGDGHFGFRVKARATSPNGRFVEALAGCSTTEEWFELTPNDWEQGVDDPKFINRQRKALARAYHDVLSTAETRATNRAAMNLIGTGEVTAEEISRPSGRVAPAERPAEPQDARRSQGVARVPQDDLLALAERAGAIPRGLDKPAALKAFGAWCVSLGVAGDLLERASKKLTDAETVAAKERLSVEVHEREAAAERARVAPDAVGRISPRTNGRLFQLLDERLSTEKEARLIFAHEHGVEVDSFSRLTEEQGRKLIRALEMIPPPAAGPDPDDALTDYAEGKLFQ